MIKNIIFDLGVVLLDVDYQATIDAFGKLGLEKPEDAFSKAKQEPFFQEYERGVVDDERFLSELSQRMGGVNPESIRSAWCAMLGELPKRKFEFLGHLKGDFRLFVLSNTNSLHQRHFERTINRQYGWKNFRNLFEFIGYSHELGHRKPDSEAYQAVLNQGKMSPDETAFIDDTLGHVEAAEKQGILGIHYRKETDLQKLRALR